MMNCELRQLNTFIKSCSTSNAAIKNTASPIPKEGWYPAYSASGQDVWLPEYRYSGKGIVVSAVGARCGKCFQADGKWNVTANTHVLLVDESIADYKYCWYLLNNENWWIKSGSGQPFVKVKDSLNRSILLPDLSTQQHIAAILDKISEGTAVCGKMMDELDLMVKAKFVEMFGALGEDKFNWGMTTLGVCCELNPKRPRDIPDDMDVSFVAMPSVTEKGQIDTSVIKPYLEVRKGFTYFAENDVLFAKITPCMENGKGCVAKGLTNAIGAGSTEFHVLRPIHGKSNPYWLYYLTVIPGFRENARKVMTGTGGQLRVPIAYLDNLPVSLPPIELQEQFATFVSKIDKSRLTIQQVLSKMEMVKLALMQEYFG